MAKDDIPTPRGPHGPHAADTNPDPEIRRDRSERRMAFALSAGAGVVIIVLAAVAIFAAILMTS